ncbi:MAG: protein TolA [Paracoccus sp. (in: a-proteobacteria)]|uniref:protein TolA n=1 Tax=Paracoccus sp. TaxID=267 RepID=UPI0026E0C6F6|nr:protein TolA [Paracoccus sp. (in: a-proteobacteria)]MDO5632096.1 protein TolA [Paracoccus sp. (in: a-proteobacteria)]
MERAERIGRWTSGVAHGGLILWAVLAGAFLRPQDGPAIRQTEVTTMSEAEFQDFAAASRGAGPVRPGTTNIAALPQPPADDSATPVPDAAAPMDTPDAAAPLPAPQAPEDQPDLSGVTPTAPVSAATELPQMAAPAPDSTPAPVPPPPSSTPPQTALAPIAPTIPQAETGMTPPAPPETAPPPRSELALDVSPRPQARPDGLVAAREARLAAAEAERQQAQEAARQAEAARIAQEQTEQAARQQAEADRIAREQAAEAARQAETDRIARERAAEAVRQAEAQRQAEAARIAQEQAEQAARQAEADRIAQERAAEAARQAEVDRIAQEQAAEAARQAEEEAARRRSAEMPYDPLAEALADAFASDPDASASTGGGLSAELQAALDDAARAEQAVRDAGAAAAVGASRTEPQGDALAMALDRALGAPNAGATDGPPLSLSEREGLMVAINACWNRAMLSLDAAQTSVSVRFQMSMSGIPDQATLRLDASDGGSPAAVQQAFEVASRAILECGRGGYALPPEKYNRWREIIVDFRPQGVNVN